jgi:acetylornithine deacetylase/succinyl-diaminopimelate desuccinylase-like protein
MRRILCLLLLAGSTVATAASPPPAALDILKRSVGFESLPGNGQVPAYAEYLRGILLEAGFAPADVRIEPFGSGSEATATLVARYGGRGRLKPMLLLGHLDVVPARREDWQRDPFTAVVENGYVYGRGAQDNKFDITMMVATLAKLKRAGWKPRREIILALTGDEETSAASAKHLAEQLRGAEFALNGDIGGGRLDEGTGAARVYDLQVAEKTYTEMTLTALDVGGHSSRPTNTNAIARLARALVKVDAHRFPPQQGEATTCTVTQVSGGHAPNALPQRAVANVNCRIIPGTTAASVRRTLEDVIADPAVTVEYDTVLTLESPASPLRADVLAAVTSAVHARHPGLPVIPFVSPGSTDGTHFRRAGVPTFGVSGLYTRASDDFAHGLNERVPVAAIDGGLDHWERLLRELAR